MNQSLDQTQKKLSSNTSQNKLRSLDFIKEALDEAESLEARLQESARNLADKDLELKIVEEKISVKSKQLEALDESVDKSQKKLTEVDRLIKYHGENKQKLLDDLTRIRKNYKDTLSGFKKESASKRFELNTQLRDIERDIKSRAEFYAEQERTRQEALESLTEQVKVLEENISNLERLQTELGEDCNRTHVSLHDLTNRIIDKSKELQNLEERKKQLQGISKSEAHVKELEEKAKVAEHKLVQLRQKEESLIAREEALFNKAQDIQIRERRLTSKERLYVL